MRSYAMRGAPLVRSPNPRQRARRLKLGAGGAMVALALGSVLYGYVTHDAQQSAAMTGPFSYFPAK